MVYACECNVHSSCHEHLCTVYTSNKFGYSEFLAMPSSHEVNGMGYSKKNETFLQLYYVYYKIDKALLMSLVACLRLCELRTMWLVNAAFVCGPKDIRVRKNYIKKLGQGVPLWSQLSHSEQNIPVLLCYGVNYSQAVLFPKIKLKIPFFLLVDALRSTLYRKRCNTFLVCTVQNKRM